MKKMNIPLMATLLVLSVVVCPILYFTLGPKLDDVQLDTLSLWGCSRHPNYFAEQAIWVCFYLLSVAAGIGIVNWSVIGALLLIVLFQGSSSLAEEISGGKYPEYEQYCKSIPRFFPSFK